MLNELAKKHIASINNKGLYDKNALMVYTYNDGIKEDNYYNPNYMNIGDYIQSLAARQFFPNIDEYIDRDQLGKYNKCNVNMIMNGWYYIWKKNKTFSNKIRPLFVSVHLTNTEHISKETLSYFKKHEPIGCRDFYTRDFLCSHGIKAYFSGCLTLTLGETYRVKEEERNDNIYFVDYKITDENFNPIDIKIKKIIEQFPKNKILHKTCNYPITKDYAGCLYEAESLIKDYAKAKLVITTRIHCALPCLALGTPVILIIPEFDKKRFLGIYNLLNVIGFDEKGNFICEIHKDSHRCITNKKDYIPYASYLKKICMAFLHLKEIPKIPCKQVNFLYHQQDVPINKVKKGFRIYKKFKNGNTRIIILFNFIKISYSKRKKRIL